MENFSGLGLSGFHVGEGYARERFYMRWFSGEQLSTGDRGISGITFFTEVEMRYDLKNNKKLKSFSNERMRRRIFRRIRPQEQFSARIELSRRGAFYVRGTLKNFLWEEGIFLGGKLDFSASFEK